MRSKPNHIILQGRVFAWIAVGTGLVLLVPLVAMQFTSEVNWGVFDFVCMGLLLFATGCVFVRVARQAPRKYWAAIAAAFAAAMLYVWAELAVGVLTRLGS